MNKTDNTDLLTYLATDIVSSYVANQKLDYKELPDVIRCVHTSLAEADGTELSKLGARKVQPFIKVEKSIQPDYIVCLEDGKKLKMLKRYLRTQYDMTPEQYRAKWGLKADYPMVAPNYAKKRSEYAKQIGLGKKRA